MVRLTKIYTRSGDDGHTALGNGDRRLKQDVRVEAYGTVDEANATLGLVRLALAEETDLDLLFAQIQNDLFDLGADLCHPPDPTPSKSGLRITMEQVTALEQAIDHYNGVLEPLNSFILPGGQPAAAYLHSARTVVRRAERRVVGLAVQEEVNPQVICYLNRLSDLLFVLARHCNGNGQRDVLWRPGEHR